MGKTAVVFPGQGSQIIGMGRDLFGEDSLMRSLIEQASDLTGRDLEKISLNGPDQELMRPSTLQPLIVSVSLCYYKRLVGQGMVVDFVAGHSLGEISAFAAAGVISFEQAVTIATKRGQLMDQVARECEGGMMAVMFVEMETVKEILDQIGEPEKIVPANDNAPGQTVLSGEKRLLEIFASYKKGKIRMVPVAGPWHSPFMENARINYQQWVEPHHFSVPQIPVILNATALEEYDADKLKTHHTYQLTNPVNWRGTMNTLRNSGVDTLFEVGPGNILLGLARANGFRKGTSLVSIDSCDVIDSIQQEARAV